MHRQNNIQQFWALEASLRATERAGLVTAFISNRPMPAPRLDLACVYLRDVRCRRGGTAYMRRLDSIPRRPDTPRSVIEWIVGSRDTLGDFVTPAVLVDILMIDHPVAVNNFCCQRLRTRGSVLATRRLKPHFGQRLPDRQPRCPERAMDRWMANGGSR